MGQRGEIFTSKRFAEDGSLTYFFNVKENRYGDLFLNLVESKKKENQFKRFSLIVYMEDLSKFLELFEEAVTKMKASIQPYQSELKTGSGKRKYSFVVKSSKSGEMYLTVAESRVNNEEGYENVSIRVFSRNLQTFLDGFDQAVDVLKSRIK
ncbi:MAG: hypothetical protein B6241_02585 [Spirochaetaceae bacterium 4572_59]|nr:MAG: hypothetical protein B6241_02585 [Spirochaetaceae bacterium 4572_59]